jgi:tripartite-type tricarboxylate transporter receptor subunit TctC
LKLPRRRFLYLATAAAALPSLSRMATAQSYPTRPVRLIIGYPPGGSADLTARLLGQWLSERLGQPFVIESRPGASTNNRGGRARAARRLHAFACCSGERDQRNALRKAQLQFHQ